MIHSTQNRATRFISAIPLLYRVVESDGDWRFGLSIDIS